MIDAVSDAHATVITLCNYDKYQSVNQEADAPADAPPTHHRRTTDAKDKEENEDKEHNSESLATDAPESTGVVGLPAAKGRKPRTKAHATKGATGDLIMAFERWWSEYPTERRIKKPKALAAYMKARATVDENTLLNSLRMFQFDRREFGRWIPEPLNWLGDERWLDGQRGEQSNLVSGRADWVARRQARVAEGDLILDGIVEEVL